MGCGPLADVRGAALEDGHVEGVDADLHEDLGTCRRRRASRNRPSRADGRIRLADQALERPVAALLDARGDARERRDRAEGAAAALELECRHVVLDAVVVARERRRSEQVDGAIRPDEPAAGEGRAGHEDGCQGGSEESRRQSSGASRTSRGSDAGPGRWAGFVARETTRAGAPVPAAYHPCHDPDRPAGGGRRGREPPRGRPRRTRLGHGRSAPGARSRPLAGG